MTNYHREDAAREVRAMTTGAAAAALLTGPLEAQVAASFYSSTWYLMAPPMTGGEAPPHIAGRWPNVPVLRLLDRFLECAGDATATLVLARALYSLFPAGEEAIDLLARIETRLSARHTVEPPAWSLQFDAWELSSAHEFLLEDEHLVQRLTFVLGFEHPCGDTHGLMVTLDDAGHVHSLALVDELDVHLEKLAEILESNGGRLLDSDVDGLAELVVQAIEHTHQRGFVPIRFDMESSGAFALLTRRVDAIPVPSAAL